MEDAAAIIREFALSESGRLSAPAVAGSALPALAVFAVALCVAFPQLAAATDCECSGCMYNCAYGGHKSVNACVLNTTICPGAAHYYALVGDWHGEGSGCWSPFVGCFYSNCGQCADWPDSP